jgi:hypothetical protein
MREAGQGSHGELDEGMTHRFDDFSGEKGARRRLAIVHVSTLLDFDHVYADFSVGRAVATMSAFAIPSPSDAVSLVRKVDFVTTATDALYAEIEALLGAPLFPPFGYRVRVRINR